MSQSITRNHFDEWMMPVYAPAAFIPVRAPGHGCGISRAKSISILPAVSP